MHSLWADIADPSTDDHSPAASPPRRISGWLLLALLLAAALPRVAMAWSLPSYCNDAYLYFFIADRLESGDVQPLVDIFGLNLYPFALRWMHALGLSWGATGEAWGVLVSSLVVLPLFGWVRRIFDDRVALVSCFLYCIHPVFIEIGVEPIRDATFWLLASLTLYCAARARQDVRRPGWFLLLAVSLALTVRTRSEGWLLLAPIGLWLAGCWFREREWRPSLAVGVLLGAVVLPVTDAGLCAILLQGEHRWDAGPLRHFRTAWTWMTVPADGAGVRSQESGVRAAATPVATPAPASSPASASAVGAVQADPVQAQRVIASPGCVVPRDEHMGAYLKNLVRTVTPPNLLFLAVGLACCGRTLLRWERVGLVLFAAGLSAAVWILLTIHSMTNGRYFLSAVLLLLPVQAIGLIPVLRSIAVYRLPRWRVRIPDGHVIAMTVAGLIVYGVADAVSSRHDSRDAEVEAARLIRSNDGSTEDVVCDHDIKRVGYHVADDVTDVVAGTQELNRRLEQQPPEWLVISSTFLKKHGQPEWWGDPGRIGYRDETPEATCRAHCPFRLLHRHEDDTPTMHRTADAASPEQTAIK